MSPIPTNAGLWDLYLEALQKALRLPNLDNFSAAAAAVPLYLNIATATVEPPVPLPIALAEVYRLGNAMPEWSRFYVPSSLQVFGQYKAFVFAIRKPDGGKDFRPVRLARQLLREVETQTAAGTGHLVMETATDAGRSTVPRFDPSSLGDPGFSSWLDLAVIAAANKLPPEVSVTIEAATAVRDRNRVRTATATVVPTASYPPFFRLETAGGSTRRTAGRQPQAKSLKLTLQSVTTVSLSPGPWFVGSLMSDYTQPRDFDPSSPFHGKRIWGPGGIFSTIPSGVAAGFRPQVTVTYPAKDFALLQHLAASPESSRISFGPFSFTLGGAEGATSVTFQPGGTAIYSSNSLGAEMLGMTVVHPNAQLG